MNYIPKHLRSLPDAELQQLAKEYNVTLPNDDDMYSRYLQDLRNRIVEELGDTATQGEINARVIVHGFPIFMYLLFPGRQLKSLHPN